MHDQLFQPLTLPASGVTLPNRLALAPMTTYSSTEDGTITDGEVEFLRRRAAGGLGTIITAACYVERAGQGFVGQWGCDDDRHLPSLARAAEAIRGAGAVALLQIHDAGRMSDPAVVAAPRAPSAVPAERPGALTPRAMSDDEIHQSIAAFAAAARRAMDAGYHGVEIHGANTYLIQQFFSPHSNRRDDDWGGDLERRLRYPLAVARAVRAAAGPGAVVGYRFSPEEIEQPGIAMDDTLALVERLAALELDYLHISLWDYARGSLRDPADERRRAPLVAERLAGRVPLMAVGAIETPEQALLPLRDGAALVALGRVALPEPEWPAKVRAGQADRIRAALPARAGDEICTLPAPLYQRLLNRPGWVKIAPED
ncbi:MAG TPA: NADH-dependent flavin oxidoreductase [Herpetosiphonaceae bacterium]|nr:NADH-dependent flavin oxidoreductase [Herpetosiphonaceae bacterium]